MHDEELGSRFCRAHVPCSSACSPAARRAVLLTRARGITATPPQIEFDDVPQLAGASLGRRREWWSQTKQLQHGSLVALWWDGSSGGTGGGAGAGVGSAAPLPLHMMFATVCDRDINLLVAKGEPRPRP